MWTDGPTLQSKKHSPHATCHKHARKHPSDNILLTSILTFISLIDTQCTEEMNKINNSRLAETLMNAEVRGGQTGK